MLNLSDNHVNIDTSKFKSFQRLEISKTNVVFKRWLLLVLGLLLIVIFLPWTQNIKAKGKITTLSPAQRPQTVQATIAGRIEKWFVRDGQFVSQGDTIVYLSEIKTDYFDPDLIARTGAQVNAKKGSVESYTSKIASLEDQIKAMKSELVFKKDQLLNKIEQTKLKAESEKNELDAAMADVQTETKQLERTEELYKKGLTPLTSLENKRLKLQQATAKKIASDNKYQASIQEIANLRFQLQGIDSEYQGKIAKSESEKFSTLSELYAAQGDVSKLQSQYSNYEKRAGFYYIVAPLDCYISTTKIAGIGETVKEGEIIATIVPAEMDLAVEIFISPIDLPLIRIGTPMRFIFDGWPAFIFSGWPNASFGTYKGKVFAIDNMTDENGKYRVLVQQDTSGNHPWPEALRPGSGAKGIALMKDVPVWYEIWRQLNGFPADYYYDFKKSTPKEKK